MEKRDNTPCMLVILDGWGITQPTRGNAIAQAKKPFFDYLVSHYQTLALQASGEVVGLNWGEMGNSEVGHMTIGSGKTLFQSLTKINKSIISKNFFTNQSMLKMEKHVKENNSSLHLIGLVSDGGVHSHQDHLYAI
ncbi:MAG: phosphoglyceromutase, partial [Parcubacteria group bacterium GW2011_GWA2_38_13]